MEERHRARYVERGTAPPPRAPHTFTPRSSRPLSFGFYGGFLTQASLSESLAVGDQFHLQSLPLPGGSGWGQGRSKGP